MQISLGASFHQIDRRYVIFAFPIFKGKITLLSPEKHEPWLRILLRSVSLEEEAAEECMFTSLLKIYDLLTGPSRIPKKIGGRWKKNQ